MANWNDAGANDGDAGGWVPDATAASGDGFSGGFAAEDISKHAGGDYGDAPNDNGCRTCGADGHFSRDCPDKKPNDGACFNCGEGGHTKAECTNPAIEREFAGECRLCAQSGHRATDCPTAPPKACRLCGDESHIAADCTINRMFAGANIDDITAEQAWAMLRAADKEKDIDDIKKAVFTYAKAVPEVTFEVLESVFRGNNMNTYLIAKEQEVSDTHTIINLQGKIDQKYVVSFQLSPKPKRAKFAEGWPATPEENAERLAEAGLPMDRMVPKCSNCDTLGHGSRQCPEDKVERAKPHPTCANCNAEGHYSRDCDKPRKTGQKECRNCGGPHMAKDCTKCRNCDEEGHQSRECPKPTDWSRVRCRNCEELGHSIKKCSQPLKKAPAGEDEEHDGNADEHDSGAAAGGDGGWGESEAPVAQGGDGW